MIEHVPMQLEMPQGHVTVDLVDADSGRVVQREEGDNFISQTALAYARWWQRLMWSHHNPNEVADALGYKPFNARVLPAEHLAYWNDTNAEVPATEHRVETPIIGYASRVPVGSATGQRGVVNITESNVSDTQAKWVFDWTTSQGNGTFRSVGWTRIHEASGYPYLGYWPEDDRVTFTHPGTPQTTNGGLWWDGTIWHTISTMATYPNHQLVSMPAAGGASTAGVSIPTTIASGSVLFIYGIAKLSGGDWIIVGYSSGNQPTVARMTAAGAQVWRRSENTLTPAGSSQHRYYDVTVTSGDEVWVCVGDGTIKKLSTSDGTILTSLGPWPFANGSTDTPLVGIAADGTNLWISSISAMWKINSSGTIIGPCFGAPSSIARVTSSTPYAGQYTQPAVCGRDAYTSIWLDTSGVAGDVISRPNVTLQTFSSQPGPLMVRSGELWAGRFSGSTTTINLATPVRGKNLSSRVLLASPVTKTSAQTLKITYTFTFS